VTINLSDPLSSQPSRSTSTSPPLSPYHAVLAKSRILLSHTENNAPLKVLFETSWPGAQFVRSDPAPRILGLSFESVSAHKARGSHSLRESVDQNRRRNHIDSNAYNCGAQQFQISSWTGGFVLRSLEDFPSAFFTVRPVLRRNKLKKIIIV